MNRDLLIILILLLINLIVAVVYLIIHLRRSEAKKGVVNFVTFLVFPIVGFVYMGIAELANLIFFQTRQRELLYDELSFSKTRMQLIQDTDVEKSLDSVSLEEALMLSNKKERRQSLMEVLKQDDYINMISNIKDAVSSEDQEISHYAATFVTETITRYKGREMELRRQMEKNPSPENLAVYVEYVREVLDSNLFEGLEYNRFLAQLDSAAWLLYSSSPEMLLDSHVTALFHYFLNAGHEEKTEEWLAVIRERSLESLECFKAYAAFCFALGDRDAFFDLLDRIKQSGVVLDNEALEWIRFFA